MLCLLRKIKFIPATATPFKRDPLSYQLFYYKWTQKFSDNQVDQLKKYDFNTTIFSPVLCSIQPTTKVIFRDALVFNRNFYFKWDDQKPYKSF
jgi:hypothetical protein